MKEFIKVTFVVEALIHLVFVVNLSILYVLGLAFGLEPEIKYIDYAALILMEAFIAAVSMSFGLSLGNHTP